MHEVTTAAESAPKARTRGTKPQPIEAALLPDALLKISTVAAVVGLSGSSIFRKLAAKQFPEPVRLGKRCTRWKAGAVMAWLAAQ